MVFIKRFNKIDLILSNLKTFLYRYEHVRIERNRGCLNFETGKNLLAATRDFLF